MLKLLKQKGPTCGACAYASILSGFGINLDERQAALEVKTKRTGTDVFDVVEALNNRGILNSGVVFFE